MNGVHLKLRRLSIRNFRSFKNVSLSLDAMHALVGANNSGKSTVLLALDFLFNPSTKKVNKESFFNRDGSLRIEVEAAFDGLSTDEAVQLAPYLRPNGEFHLLRTASVAEDGPEGVEDESKVSILAHYSQPQPKIDWLNQSKINGSNIKEWWKEKDSLAVGGASFADQFSGGTPKVADWKEKALEFAAKHLTHEDWVDEWIPNPQGYAGVLKATLPHFELIPAVREVSDESRVTKSNPFGRLIYAILNSLDSGLKASLEVTLAEAVRRLNRIGQKERLDQVRELETTIGGFLSEVLPADLELEFQSPTVEVLLTTPKLLVDDGFRGSVDGKGHGMQRAVIFSILRAYAQLVSARENGTRKSLILGIEEPELYMHPTAQRTIRRVLRAIADGGDQVIFSTHTASQARAQVGVADASLVAARAVEQEAMVAAREAKRARERTERLLPSGGVSQEQVDLSRAADEARTRELDAARAHVSAARYALESARAFLPGRAGAPVQLRAPGAGVVLRVDEEHTRVVPAGSPLLQVGSLDAPEIVARVLSADAPRVRLGTALIVVVGQDTLRGRVTRVEPTAWRSSACRLLVTFPHTWRAVYGSVMTSRSRRALSWRTSRAHSSCPSARSCAREVAGVSLCSTRRTRRRSKR